MPLHFINISLLRSNYSWLGSWLIQWILHSIMYQRNFRLHAALLTVKDMICRWIGNPFHECDKYNESAPKQCEMNLSSRRWNFYPEASNLHEVIRISKEDKSHFKNITLLFRNYLTMCAVFHCICIAWLSAQNLFLSTHRSLQSHIPFPPQFKCIFWEGG